MSLLEIAANAVNTLAIWLAARNHVYNWPAGIAGCALFSVVFLSNQLYADATLQIFFIVTNAVGWWQWRHPASPRQSGDRPITRARPQTIGWMLVAGLGVCAGYGWLLHRFTNAFMPYVDAAVLALSVIAQFLLMQRKIETWPFWLGVNTLSVGLFASRGLYLTALLYTAYWINAWYGWRRWHRQQTGMRPAAAGVP